MTITATTLDAPAPTPQERLVPGLEAAVDRFEPPVAPSRRSTDAEARAANAAVEPELLGSLKPLTRYALKGCVERSLEQGTLSTQNSGALRELLGDEGFSNRLAATQREDLIAGICGLLSPPRLDRTPALRALISNAGQPREAFHRQPPPVQSALIAAAGPFTGGLVSLIEAPGFERLEVAERARVVASIGALLAPRGNDPEERERLSVAARWTLSYFEGWKGANAPSAGAQADVLRDVMNLGTAPFLEDRTPVAPPTGTLERWFLGAGDVVEGRRTSFLRLGRHHIAVRSPAETTPGWLPSLDALGSALARRSPEELSLIRCVELGDPPPSNTPDVASSSDPSGDPSGSVVRFHPSTHPMSQGEIEESLSRELGHLLGWAVFGPNGDERGWQLYRSAMRRDRFVPGPYRDRAASHAVEDDLAAAYARFRSVRREELTPIFTYRFAMIDAALKALQNGFQPR